VKETLFCFENFNLVDSFKVYDTKGKGFLTRDCLKELEDEIDVEALVEYLDTDKDGKLSYTEWTRALTPRNIAYSQV
jgi:Ca2+-binding EF-hand superfamily protein